MEQQRAANTKKTILEAYERNVGLVSANLAKTELSSERAADDVRYWYGEGWPPEIDRNCPHCPAVSPTTSQQNQH